MADEKADFAKRINKLCDENGIPPEGKGRQKAVAALFKVSQPAARKWLKAEGLPELHLCIRIARKWRARTEWLVSGRGPKEYEESESDFEPGVLDIARRIVSMPSERRTLLMELFNSGEDHGDKPATPAPSPPQ